MVNPLSDFFDFSPVNMAFAETNFPVPVSNPPCMGETGFGDASGTGMDMGVGAAAVNTEFSWLLPGGNIPYYFPDQQV